jgi:hypothetical protein
LYRRTYQFSVLSLAWVAAEDALRDGDEKGNGRKCNESQKCDNASASYFWHFQVTRSSKGPVTGLGVIDLSGFRLLIGIGARRVYRCFCL